MDQSETLAETSSRLVQRVPLRFDVLLAIYFSFLLTFIYESRPPNAWSAPRRYLYFWHPHAVSLRGTDFVLFYLEIFLIPAVVILGCLRLMGRFLLIRPLLRIGGAVAIAGFPIVCLYGAERPLSFVVLEPAVAAAYFVLWAYRKWPVSTALNVLLLFAHYAFWFFFAVSMTGMARLDRPLALWGLWEYMAFVYPALGFSYSLVWALYSRRVDAMPTSRSTP